MWRSQADTESNAAAQAVMHALQESHSWLQGHADEEEAEMLARVSTCMTDERVPLQDKQNVVQARPHASPAPCHHV